MSVLIGLLLAWARGLSKIQGPKHPRLQMGVFDHGGSIA